MNKAPAFLALGLVAVLLISVGAIVVQEEYSGEELKGKYPYSTFQKTQVCRNCHVEIYEQWSQSLMSQAYTHHWDEIEYFELAVPHGEKDPKFKPVSDGCNGCHTPLAYMAGDVTPPRPEENSRANESVSCVVCHVIKGWKSDNKYPYNFSYIVDPRKIYRGNRQGVVSPEHTTELSELFSTAQLCGNCHNEQSPWGVWVKGTQKEWAEGPYAAQGVHCQECHMPVGHTRNAKMGTVYEDTRQHLFHGAHDEGKVRGAVEMRITPDAREVEMGEPVKFTLVLHNAKVGHMIPSGSAEERQLWVRVEAIDSKGKIFHLPVDKKGFDGEEHTITSNEPAYFDMGEMRSIPDFKGVPRDALPEGDRIFTLPYFNEKGERTIAQWNTASQGVDYRIPPRGSKVETYTWELPFEMADGEVTIRATLNYRRLVKSVADFLKVPADETEIIQVNTAETKIKVFD